MAKKQPKAGYQEPPAEGTMKLKKLVKPRSHNQKTYWDALNKFTFVFGVGPAGTGKTYLAVAYALKLLRDGEIERIIITRPVVNDEEDLGFLPGTADEKMAPWMRPIKDAIAELAGGRMADKLYADGTIEICPLSFMKGRTFKSACVIADEMSDATIKQMKMALTRIGEGSRFIVLGDPKQSNLPDHVTDGLSDFVNAHKQFNQDTGGIKIVHLGKRDIIRHALIPTILSIYGDEELDIEYEGDKEEDLGKMPS